jgi:hypothetical protein
LSKNWTTQASVQWIPGLFPGIKWLGLKVDPLPPLGAEVKNEWSYTSSSPV